MKTAFMTHNNSKRLKTSFHASFTHSTICTIKTLIQTFNSFITPKNPSSPIKISSWTYLKYRELYIEWLEELCLSIKPNLSVLHLSIKIFDKVNLLHKYSNKDYQALALSCLNISYKFQVDNFFISFQDLASYCPNKTTQQFRNLEIEVLKLIDWKIFTMTAYDYILLYIDFGLALQTDKIKTTLPLTKINELLHKYAEVFVEVANRIEGFVNLDSNIIACTCLAMARKKVGINDYWNTSLEHKTKIKQSALVLSDLESKYYKIIKKS